MTLTSFLAKVLVSTLATASMVTLTATAVSQEVEQPVVLVATTTPPIVVATSTPPQVKKVPIVKAAPKTKGNCLDHEGTIRKYDWPVDIALEVCAAESSGNPVAVGDRSTAYVSCGLMQIRTLPGRPSCAELKVPETNIAYAYALWVEEGWAPWSVCRLTVDCTK